MKRFLAVIALCVYDAESYTYSSMSCTSDSSYRNSLDGSHNAFKSGYFLAGQYSVHDDDNEDRQFKWDYCKPTSDPDPFSTTWAMSQTGYDATWTKDCGGDAAIWQAYSTHHNKHEDRVWTFYCKGLDTDKFRLENCAWTGYVNGYDATVNYQCGSNGVLQGIKSEHHNKHEDRIWKFECCRLVDAVEYTDMTCITDTDYVDSWEGESTTDERPQYFISGQEVTYVNNVRRLKWTYCEPQDVQQEMALTDLTVTDVAGTWLGECIGDDEAMVGNPNDATAGSPVHHTFECGLLDTSMYKLTNCESIYIASTDGDASYTCSDNGVLTSLKSIDNGGAYRDWEFTCCRIADASSPIFEDVHGLNPLEYVYDHRFRFTSNVVYGVGVLFCLLMLSNLILLFKSWCCKSKRRHYKAVSMQSTDDEVVAILE